MLNHIKTYSLFESLSDTLYHFTRHDSLVSMLKDGKLNLTMAVGSSSDLSINKNKFYFFSMQTSRNAGYGRRRKMPVMLVMDGRKLNYNFKGGPVDYWGKSWSDRHEFDEFEERLMSDRGEIDMRRYVREIHVYIGPGEEGSQKARREFFGDHINIQETASYIKHRADELGIPVYFYDNQKYYFNNVKAKSVQVEGSESHPGEDDYHNRHWGAMEIMGLVAGGDEEQIEKIATEMVDSGLKKLDMPRTQYIEAAKKNMRDFAYKWRLEHPSDFWMNDLRSSITADIHNARDTRNKFLRWTFEKLTQDMKKYGAKNIKEYLDKKFMKK